MAATPRDPDERTFDEIVDDIEAKSAKARQGLLNDPGFVDPRRSEGKERFYDSGSEHGHEDDQTITPG